MTAPARPGHVLFLVTEDWYFCLHRLPIAVAAREAGYRVSVMTRVDRHGEEIRAAGLELIPMNWNRLSMSPLQALREIRAVTRAYRRLRPDVVHHVAIRPSVLGTIAAARAGVPRVVNNLAGLGYAFCSRQWRARLLRRVLVPSFRRLFRRPNTCTIVENSDDRDFLVREVGVPAPAVALVRGIGVDTRRFRPEPAPATGPVVVTLVSRMLWPKGIAELVRAARLLRQRGHDVRVRLVGRPDPRSQAAVPEARLRQWHADGVVEWLGHRDDIPAVWAGSHLAVLPSWYREGIPRSLLEAAACGRPVVTTDTPGCRELVVPGVNGLLVPPRDAEALAGAIATLAADPDLRARMGRAGRERVEREFAEERVVADTLAVYAGGARP